jgi:integrase
MSKTFVTRRDAERWARRTEAELDKGVLPDASQASRITVAEALNRYPWPNSREQGRAKRLTQALGAYTLATLTPGVLSSYRDSRLQVVGANTVRLDLALLSVMFGACEKEWDIHLPHGNPVRKVRSPKVPPGRDRRLQPGEEARLLQALERAPVIRAIVLLALETGMRRGELVSLRWSNVDLEQRVALLPTTKNGTARRVPLSTRATELLLDLSRHAQRDAEADRVFPVAADSVTQAFERACKRAGIEDLRFHDLRREATSRLFAKGLSIMEVATITGHKSLSMLKRYTHLRAEDLVKKLD